LPSSARWHSQQLWPTLLTPRLVHFALPSTELRTSGAGPLLSWNDSNTKQSIVDFVARVTKDGSPDFVPVPERIAVFDNDGTLWAEQPMHCLARQRSRG
jgi:hypothetical protein